MQQFLVDSILKVIHWYCINQFFG